MRLPWWLKALILLLVSAGVFGSTGWFAYEFLIKPNQPPPPEEMAAPQDISLPEFERVMEFIRQHRHSVEARTALEHFMEMYPFSSKMPEARKALGELNSDIFFSAIPAPEKISYEVQRGDTVDRIKRRLKTTEELIMRCNNLEDPRKLRIGQTIMVTPLDFSILIDRKARTVTLLNAGKFFKQYDAASWNVRGTENTPLETKVTRKLAWNKNVPVHFGSKEYAGSERWVETAAKGFTLYSEGGKKPSSGIGIDPEGMEEISTLVDKGVPVSVR